MCRARPSIKNLWVTDMLSRQCQTGSTADWKPSLTKAQSCSEQIINSSSARGTEGKRPSSVHVARSFDLHSVYSHGRSLIAVLSQTPQCRKIFHLPRDKTHPHSSMFMQRWTSFAVCKSVVDNRPRHAEKQRENKSGRETLRTTGVLDLTHRYHLLSQVVLVFSNAAIPSSNRLVLANHDVLGDFVKQSVNC